MKSYLENVLYHEGELWVQPESDYFLVGVTDFGQEFFRDIQKIELPKVDNFYKKEEILAVIETDKVSTEIHFPVSGKVIELNMKVETQPNLINQFPFTKGWILKMQDVSLEELEQLESVEEYQKFLATFFKK